MKLYAPESYVTASPEVRKAAVNGCGPGGWKVDLVSDSIWGLSIHDCCDIHDWMYTVGQTIADKDEADRVFLNNCMRLIESKKSNWFIKGLRMRAAKDYYDAVHYFGGPAFWANVNEKKNYVVQGESV